MLERSERDDPQGPGGIPEMIALRDLLLNHYQKKFHSLEIWK